MKPVHSPSVVIHIFDGEGANLPALFARIAQAEGWQPGDALYASADRSIYFAAFPAFNTGTDASAAIGGIQLVLPNDEETLPTLAVWPELAAAMIGQRNIAHVSVLAIIPEWRARNAFWPLCVSLWRYCVQQRIEELWLEATPAALKAYQRLGWPLSIRGELRRHWGEDCYPCSLNVCEVAGTLTQKAVNSPAYRHVLQLACEGVPSSSV